MAMLKIYLFGYLLLECIKVFYAFVSLSVDRYQTKKAFWKEIFTPVGYTVLYYAYKGVMDNVSSYKVLK